MDFIQVYRIPYYYNQILYYHPLIIMDLDTLYFIGYFIVSLFFNKAQFVIKAQFAFNFKELLLFKFLGSDL